MRLRPHLLMVLAIVVANAPLLFGVFDGDPSITIASIISSDRPGVLPGWNSIDPNNGLVSQAMGHEAAEQWLRGSVPYWNHHQGIGGPLAGEMQSAAFFPLVFLLLLPNGLLYLHVILQIVAAVGTYRLLRRFVGEPAAVIGGIAFALCGTFAWFGNAVVNPVAFLPWMLLGVETAFDDDAGARLRSIRIVAVSMALGTYSGFPELVYLHGLLALAWAVLRMVQRRPAWRTPFATLVLGVLAGTALAAPILGAFLTYLPHADVAGHSGDMSAGYLHPVGLGTVTMPYVFGPIQAYGQGGPVELWWSNVGGYLAASVVGLAVVGVWSAWSARRERGLALVLLGFAAVSLLKVYGAPLTTQLFGLIPAMKAVAFYRYGWVGLIFCLVVLAAFGADALVERRASRRVALVAVGVVALLSAGQLVVADEWVTTLATRRWAAASVLLGGAATAGILLTVVLRRDGWRAAMLIGAVALESAALFVIPQFSTRRDAVIDEALVEFLQANIGTASFVTLGPLAPNYGTYWDIRSASINDVPEPKAYMDHVRTKLDPNTNPVVFDGLARINPEGPTLAQNLVANLDAFRDLGVRYVVGWTGRVPSAPGLREVFTNPVHTVLEIEGARSYAEASPGCTVESATFEELTVDCAAAGSVVRRELYLPGWGAAVNGTDVTVHEEQGLYQRVDVPAGRSTVTISFLPPFATWFTLAAGAVAIGLLAPWRWLRAADPARRVDALDGERAQTTT